VTAVARYLLAEHARSGRFVAPLVLLVAAVLILSGQPPLSASGSVAAVLVALQAWLGVVFFNTQGTTDRHVIAAAVGARRFIGGRLLAGAALAVATALAAWGVEVVGALIHGELPMAELGLALVGYLTATLAGTALAALFAQPLVQSRPVAVFGIAISLLVSVPLEIPPTITIAKAFDGRTSDVPDHLVDDVTIVVLFAALVVAACLELGRRRE
jgi:hypothetical protein